MDYKVLYRKYRPNDFNEIVGQEHIKNILKNSIINNKIAHAYIFTGPRGTGKTSTAKIFAKSLNCLDIKDGISCGKCDNCINFKTSPDIIEMDAASNNGVDDIRNIIENVEIAPTNSKYKIYIIDEVHMLSQAAFNAFLKTLEEPPNNVIFILATTDIQKVPITVLSRCQRFDFQRIDRNLIKDNLINICQKEQILYEEEALNEIAYISEGCMRDALSTLDQLSKTNEKIDIECIKRNYGTITKEDIEKIYSAILYNNLDELIQKISQAKESGINIKVFIDKMLDYLIEKAISMKKKNLSNNSFKQIKLIITNLNNLLSSLNSNSNGYLLLELELISFINDENNQLSNREVNQIISREIIQFDTKIDINQMLTEQKKAQIYNICEDFINVRINNSFVDANKEAKNEFLKLWQKFIDDIVSQSNNDYMMLTKNIIPQVVSKSYVLFLTTNESNKIIINNKLYEIETKFNSENKTKYKMIFITKTEWNEYMKTYDKTKKYNLMDETEFIVKNNSSLQLAEEVFGSEKINIE